MAAMTLRQTGSHLRSDRSSLRPNQRMMGVCWTPHPQFRELPRLRPSCWRVADIATDRRDPHQSRMEQFRRKRVKCERIAVGKPRG
jgi:hypothetical protein